MANVARPLNAWSHTGSSFERRHAHRLRIGLVAIVDTTEAPRLTNEREAPESLLDSERISVLAAPEFKALSHNGSRKGVRLEAIYWRVLEEAAADIGLSRNALVFKVLMLASADQSNATSVLRTFLIAYVLLKRKTDGREGAFKAMMGLVQALPQPALLIERDTSVAHCNESLAHLCGYKVDNTRHLIATAHISAAQSSDVLSLIDLVIEDKFSIRMHARLAVLSGPGEPYALGVVHGTEQTSA